MGPCDQSMMKLGVLGLNPGCVQNVPNPVQTLKFARIFRSVILMGLERLGPSITTLVVVPFARTLDDAADKTRMRIIVRVFFILYPYMLS